jgi:glycolate oxidase iron-sulfur subunit
METHLADWLKDTTDGVEAENILRKCVHCGFCTATCPTYQLLGDELDGPRGRIYLIKQVLEGKAPTVATQTHLDRCLTCRNCESTCPSGVQYGRLVDIGRKLVDEKVERPLSQRIVRTALREGLTARWLFEPAMKIGKAVRPMLPASLQAKVPENRNKGTWPTQTHARKVLMLNGCVQPAMMPTIDFATARVLDALGIQATIETRSGCCGAIRHHLNDHHGSHADIKRNIDAWWPHIEQGIEAIVVNASGCGAMVSEYGYLLRDDADYKVKAAKVSELFKDIVTYIAPLGAQLQSLVQTSRKTSGSTKAAYHPPCTQQHGLKIKGDVEKLLVQLGIDLKPVADSHLCCGSAGTYSVTQPVLSKQLRDNKLDNLQAGQPEVILSANIGCLTHLQSGTATPVRHWIEWLDEQLSQRP